MSTLRRATGIYVTGTRRLLRITVTVVGDIEAEWSAGGSVEDYQLHVQTSTTEIVSYGSDDVKDAPWDTRRLIVGAINDPDGLLVDVNGAEAAADVVIWFLTEPIPPADLDPLTPASPKPRHPRLLSLLFRRSTPSPRTPGRRQRPIPRHLCWRFRRSTCPPPIP